MNNSAHSRYEVAIIGMAGRFPGAMNVEQFWRNLEAGIESISSFPTEDLIEAGVTPADLENPHYVNARGVLADIELFDSEFFGFIPREADLTDPQHRLFLEVVWEAMEDAAYIPQSYPGAVGVFAGAGMTGYWANLYSSPEILATTDPMQVVLGNDKDYLATRISYKLNLRGPSVTVQTACSTSLVAVHMACQSLINGECDLAIAGGVSFAVPLKTGYRYQSGGILSPDGHCRAFDARALGTVPGSAVGAVVLKRLEDAIQDGDHIRAVILGSAINNDGASKAGFTAPAIDGQAEVIAEAQAMAEVSPESIQFIEAHGTGTELGDRIEVAALTKAFRAGTSQTGFCALGSTKANIGHADTAAGVVGLIKTVLALEHRIIPPLANFEEPNPACEFSKSPFYLSGHAVPWPCSNGPRIAGVSSFGLGGTNSHLILKGVDVPAPVTTRQPWHLLVLSARTPAALEQSSQRLASYFERPDTANFADVVFTLQAGRVPFPYRRTIVCEGPNDAVRALRDDRDARVITQICSQTPRSILLVFSAEWIPSGSKAGHQQPWHPEFQKHLNHCSELLAAQGIRLQPDLSFSDRGGLAAHAIQGLEQFVSQYCIAQLLLYCNIKPGAMLGLGIGELVAACINGGLSLSRALSIAGDLESRGANKPSDKIGKNEIRIENNGAVRSLGLPYISGSSGGWISGAEERDEGLWYTRASSPVNSGKLAQTLTALEPSILVQVGTGDLISNLIGGNPAGATHKCVRVGAVDVRCLLEVLASLWREGTEPAWLRLHEGEERRRVSLPSYPFQRKRHWIQRRRALPGRTRVEESGRPVEKQLPVLQPVSRDGKLPVPEPSSHDSQLVVTSALPDRIEQLSSELLQIASALTGLDAGAIDRRTNFFDAGVDSLLLIQFAEQIHTKFGVQIGFRQMFDELPTIESVAVHLHSVLPEEQPQKLAAEDSSSSADRDSRSRHEEAEKAGTDRTSSPASVNRESEVQKQLDSLQQQLDLLRNQMRTGEKEAADFTNVARTVSPSSRVPAQTGNVSEHSDADRSLTETQRRHVQGLVARYVNRTPKSKSMAQEYRAVLADNRTSAGFRSLWKEMVYPIVADRSHGARFWDVDGNEYIDLTMGFGVSLFGHAPQFVVDAAAAQLKKGFQLGPQSHLAGEVASLISELTHTERVGFCNSGTEAVMLAVRLARAATGRTRIAYFSGSYHGTSDWVSFRNRAGGDAFAAVPIAPGVPGSIASEVLVLPYGTRESLECLEANAKDLAAVLVEPVQSRRPGFQPVEFLRDVRSLTSASRIPLIFDEVITGFRVHPGGAQALFGIFADLTTYGKVIAGGLPIGVVAGRAEYLDAIDGGQWSFGDQSVPLASQTVFAGTFCKHPLAMAAAHAVLRRLTADGLKICSDLNHRTERFVQQINALLMEKSAPMRLDHFGSLFNFQPTTRWAYADLLPYHLINRGVYVWEGPTRFLSTAHTEADLDQIRAAVAESLEEMRTADMFPESRGEKSRISSPAADTAAVNGENHLGEYTATVPQQSTSFSLTEAQQEIWMLCQFGMEASRAFNESASLNITGRLDVEKLRRAVSKLGSRHEAFRTRFSEDGQFQVIEPSIDLTARYKELHDHESIEDIITAEARIRFDPAQSGLVRFLIIRRNDDHHVVVITVHHIICDAFGMGLIIRELMQLYEAECGRSTPPSALPGSFGRYLQLQRTSTGLDQCASNDSYWRDHLQGAEFPLQLPTNRPRPQVPSFKGGQARGSLQLKIAERLRDCARENGATVYVTALAAFSAFLHRLAGKQDIVIGVPVAGQITAGEHCVGHCLEILPLRSQVSRDMSFFSLIQQTREAFLHGYEHRPFSMRHVLEMLDSAKMPGFVQPLSVTFNLERGSQMRVGELEIEAVSNPTGCAKFDLAVDMVERREGFEFIWTYDADLFDQPIVGNWMQYWISWLEEILLHSVVPIFKLNLLPDSHRIKILELQNQTDRPYPFNASVHQTFERWVALQPSAVALSSGSGEMSYGTLNARANQLANFLVAQGIKPEDTVGLCFDPCQEMIVSMLGVLKAGAAYVPFNPADFSERFEWQIKDAGIKFMLTEQKFLSQLKSHNLKCLCLDSQAEVAEDESTQGLPNCSALNLAYVLYTSGSTGHPKGVAVTHRGILRLVRNSNYMRISTEDAVAQASNYAWDMATFEIWAALLNGARLVLLKKEDVLAPDRLKQLIDDKSITIISLATAIFDRLVQEEPACFRSIRQMIFGGDKPNAESVETLLQQDAGTRLISVYGPTENTSFSSYFDFSENCGQAVYALLGPPVSNSTMYLLDRDMRPVGCGMIGEIFVGGDGLARGYFGRPDLTAVSFVPHVSSRGFGERLYRTGDLGFLRADGNIEFMGRADRQVKLHGIRVELAEIEAVLRKHPAINDVLVTIEPGHAQRLLAYVIANGGAVPSGDELRDFSEHKLPPYMVPSYFIPLERFPLTSNGKVDRLALPGPSDLSNQDVAPRGMEEEILADIWADILSLKSVSMDDNFFEQGGHSLLAMQFISRVRAVFGIELPFPALFEAPTPRQLLQRIHLAKSSARAFPPPISRTASGDRLPLSFAQQRLWFLEQLAPGQATYNVPLAMRLHGSLNELALEHSLKEIVRRHQVLRTVITSLAGQPLQTVQDKELALARIDLTGLDTGMRELELVRLARKEARRTFNLAHELMLRATLVRLGDEEHAVFVTMHHIASDGWSLGVLTRELVCLYGAFSQENPSPLPELPIQYADYSVWQREWLNQERIKIDLDYWRDQLKEIGKLQLPLDHPRPSSYRHRGQHSAVRLSAELTSSLAALARVENVTLYMTLLAAFQTLLQVYSGDINIAVGSPIAGRTRTETEPLIGFFANNIVLVASFEDNPDIHTLLSRSRKSALDAYTHQELPFEKLVEELHPERDIAHNPLFQVMFVWQNAPSGNLSIPGLSFSPLDTSASTSKFDLTLSLQKADDQIAGVLEYNADLFEPATIERLLHHLRTVLRLFVEQPERRVSELVLLDAAEQEQVVVEWNMASADYPSEYCIHEVFEAQCRNTPSAVAVMSQTESLTYEELNRQANQLARFLQRLEVGAEVCVGICAARSVKMVVGLLGILKSGAAYVPLDPAWPKERIHSVISSSNLAVVLTHQQLVSLLPDHTFKLCLDRDWQLVSGESGDDIDADVCPDNLAYVMHTSGSTGEPKGVQICHRGVVRLLADQGCIRFGCGCAYLHHAPLGFDISTLEIWGPLLHGGRTVLFDGSITDPASLGKAIIEHKITTLNLPAPAFNLLVDSAIQILEPLTEIIMGAEAASVSHVCRAVASLPRTRMVNAYGPTEASTTASYWTISRQLDSAAESVPIGRPLSNTTLYVLNSRLQPTPVGVCGELYIGGPGVARGYLHQPALTAERFLPDPFSSQPGARLYRTGDRVRYRPDGTLLFVGRLDDQVKVRGYRIEPGEVQAVLLQHPAVARALVLSDPGPAGVKQLVAYIVPAEQSVPTEHEMQEYLSSKLPSYMVPAIFTFLHEFPLKPNGKVDRAALPSPVSRSPVEEHYEPPSTTLEHIVAGVWAEVLQVPQPGRRANFFDLGGHSLLATQVITRVSEHCGLDVPLKLLFQAPVLSDFCRCIQEQGREASQPPLMPVDRSVPLPLSFAQQRLWFLDQLQPGNPSYHISNAVELKGRLNPEILRISFTEIVRRHEILRTTFCVLDGEPFQSVGNDCSMPFCVADLRDLPPTMRRLEASAILKAAGQLPFNLETGPLLRIVLLRIETEEYLLFVGIHHIVCDGWSIGVLLRELSVIYNALATGARPDLPALAVQYGDYAVWQQTWMDRERVQAELDYWKQQLAGVAVLDMPSDFPRPPLPSLRGASETFLLDANLVEGLHRVAREEGATLFVLLLAAFQTLLSRYSRQRDIALGTPVAGRTRIETEPLIGCFVNTVVLRTDLSGSPTWKALIQRCRLVALDAFEHQHLPFERLVEVLQPERDLSRTPLFQVMLALQNAALSARPLDKVRLQPAEVQSSTSKFDLTLILTEIDHRLAGRLEYSTDLFTAESVQRMIRHFENLLQNMAAKLHENILAAELLSPEERAQLLIECNQTHVQYEGAQCAHLLVADQARKSPHAQAVIYEGGALTYAELEGRANQVAHHLRKLGIGPEKCVAVCLERGPELVISLLGIWKAGGVYVPLDPGYPAERLAYVLSDVRAPLLLTVSGSPVAEIEHGAQTVLLDRDWQEIARESMQGPENLLAGENLAYTIYTSGSTGRPKGAMIEHRGLVNHLWAKVEAFELGSEDVVAQTASAAFDISIWQIVAPLLTGGKVEIITDRVALDPEALLDKIGAGQISVIETVPALLSLIVDSAERRSGERPCRALKWMICNGDALPLSLCRRWRDLYPAVPLVNAWGTTECSDDATHYEFLDRLPKEPACAPLGRPLRNMRVYVLDQELQPVPIGVVGELYIGGEGVGRGYLGRPELTADKFLPDPFAPESGSRLYRTGDEGSRLPGGDLEFIGRIDYQVKVRGYRIEIGEIESVLNEHHHISQSAVLACGDSMGEKRLVAYVVAKDQTLNAAEVDSYLQQRLPKYMVPAAFVMLEELPLTHNGKVDRKALAAIPVEPARKSEFVAPRSALEEKLAAIWKDAIGLESIGVYDNFFEVGGHSLVAVKIASRIREQFGVDFPLALIFEKTTIAELAPEIVARRLGAVDDSEFAEMLTELEQ